MHLLWDGKAEGRIVMALIEKCSQDHKKIQAGAQDGIGVWCGVCGINLSKKVTQAFLSAKKTSEYMTIAQKQDMKDAGRGHLL